MISVKHAIKWIFSAWNDVQTSTIVNSFKHAGVNILHVEEMSTKPEVSIESQNLLELDNIQMADEDVQIYI